MFKYPCLHMYRQPHINVPFLLLVFVTPMLVLWDYLDPPGGCRGFFRGCLYIMAGVTAKAIIKQAKVLPTKDMIPIVPSFHFKKRLNMGRIKNVPENFQEHVNLRTVLQYRLLPKSEIWCC